MPQKEASVRRPIGIALLGLLAVVVSVHGQSSSQSSAKANPLVGAWKVTEIDDVNKPAITNPQPGLYVFTEEHYSFLRINGTAPLPAYASNAKATDADKVAVFDAIFVNSGTYTVNGNTLATKVQVAKSAFVLGSSAQYEFAVNGKELVLTQKSGAALKLERVE
jgi:hypothetical protein